MGLADKINKNARKGANEVTDKPKLKRETNTTIACNKELRDRLHELAVRRRMPMQRLLEDLIETELAKAGI